MKTCLEFRDKEGNEITIERWNELLEDVPYRIIKQENIGSYRVSTIWLGLDHFGKNFFETMVFPEKDYEELSLDRYQTVEQAKVGHDEVAAAVRRCVENGEKYDP